MTDGKSYGAIWMAAHLPVLFWLLGTLYAHNAVHADFSTSLHCLLTSLTKTVTSLFFLN